MKEDYWEIYSLESSPWWKDYWWPVGRDFTTLLWLRKIWRGQNWRILDLGCGLGETTRKLESFGTVIGVDTAKEAVQMARERGLSQVEVMNICSLSLPSDFFDLVTAFDVLEHIEDDQKALGEICRVLKKGGLFLLTVPACPWLWSFHDESLGHKRRYTKKNLEEKVKKAGLVPIRSSYLILSFFFPIAIFRLAQRVLGIKGPSYLLLPRFLNIFFGQILKLEGIISQFFSFPFGVSLILLGRKK